MTTISKRANAYRTALRQALNDGLSIKAATNLAKAAATGNSFPMPPKPPVVLTDEELRLIDENELTADECDRLDELEQAEVNSEERALNDSLPSATPKSDAVADLAKFLGISIVRIKLSDVLSLDNADTDVDEGDDPNCECGCEDHMTDALGQQDDGERFMADIRTHELMEEACGLTLKAPSHIQLTIAARRAAKLEGNCEDGYDYEPGGLVAQAISDAAKEDYLDHGDEPVDLGDFGAGTLADAWRDGVGIKTPAGLRIKAKAAFMAELDEALNPGCTDRELAAVKDYVDYGEDLSHEEKVAAGMPDDGIDGAAEWAEEERRHQAEREEECPTTRRVRDCDIPATLRAIELPATEDHSSYRLWFDGDDEMHQFLAGRCLYADDGRCIKDEDGKTVGMWFYAHFGPTPVS